MAVVSRYKTPETPVQCLGRRTTADAPCKLWVPIDQKYCTHHFDQGRILPSPAHKTKSAPPPPSVAPQTPPPSPGLPPTNLGILMQLLFEEAKRSGFKASVNLQPLSRS